MRIDVRYTIYLAPEFCVVCNNCFFSLSAVVMVRILVHLGASDSGATWSAADCRNRQVSTNPYLHKIKLSRVAL